MGKIQLKLEKLVFYIFIFSIPFQTRIILKTWGPNFNEWEAAFFYFTDVLLLCLVFSWLFRRGEFRFEKADWFLVLFLVFSAVSLINANVLSLGFYQLAKLFEFSLLYFYIKSNHKKIFRLQYAWFVLAASGIFQGTIALLQYIRQSSLGLKYLGESLLSPEVYGVAAFKVAGDLVMRAYGTFPHPNVLAAFLFMTIYIFYALYFSDWGRERKWILFFYVPMLTGFIFTYSRLIGLLWFAGGLARFLILVLKPRIRKTHLRNYAERLIIVVSVSILIVVAVYLANDEAVHSRLSFSTSEEAYVARSFYNKKSLESFSFFGYGAGNHIPWLRSELPGMPAKNYQPVHNIYLLILNETGILGLAAFILFMLFLSVRYLKSVSFDKLFHYSFFIAFLSFLVMGFFDHYLWSLQQGRILFWFALGVLALLGRLKVDK